MQFLHACAWRRRTRGMQPCGNDWPGGWDCPMKIAGHFIHFFPLKQPNFSSVWHGPSPGGLLLSTLVSKWAALTLTLCTQHCVPVSHPHVPHQIFTPTCFSTVFQVSSCLTHLLMDCRRVISGSAEQLMLSTLSCRSRELIGKHFFKLW